MKNIPPALPFVISVPVEVEAHTVCNLLQIQIHVNLEIQGIWWRHFYKVAQHSWIRIGCLLHKMAFDEFHVGPTIQHFSRMVLW